MVEMDDLAGKVFALLKGNGLKIKIFDETGAETTNPNDGRRFFVTSPNLMVTIDEDGNKVEFSKGSDTDDEAVTSLQKNIRKLADGFLMNSDIKVFGKQIQPRDYAYQAKIKGAAAMNENMKPRNHHLMAEVLQKIKYFGPRLSNAGYIAANLDHPVGLEDIQPVLNTLVQDGKIMAKPDKHGIPTYSIAVDEAVMENAGNIGVHNLKGMDSEEAYDTTQTGDIKDGDVLLVDGGVAIMYKAWPCMVSGDFPGFHKFNDESSVPEMDGGKYAASYQKALDLSHGNQSMMESFSRMFGSLKTSQQTLENVRILVKHKVPVDENVRGSRARHISAIFLECNGERFRFPHNYLPGARAMAQHMAHGGVPSDKVGTYIAESTGNLLKLQSFNRYVTTNKLINEDSSGIVETVKENIETLRTELKKLSGSKTYETVKARLETFEREALAEDDTSTLKDLFTIRRFDEKFEGVLPIIKQLVQEKDTFHKRIEEAAANVVLLRRESLNTTPMFEFASENARLGFKLNELALRILENEELAGFINKIGTKLCKEGVVNDFEKAVLTQVLENVQIAEKQAAKEIKEAADLSAYYDKYTHNFY